MLLADCSRESISSSFSAFSPKYTLSSCPLEGSKGIAVILLNDALSIFNALILLKLGTFSSLFLLISRVSECCSLVYIETRKTEDKETEKRRGNRMDEMRM